MVNLKKDWDLWLWQNKMWKPWCLCRLLQGRITVVYNTHKKIIIKIKNKGYKNNRSKEMGVTWVAFTLMLPSYTIDLVQLLHILCYLKLRLYVKQNHEWIIKMSHHAHIWVLILFTSTSNQPPTFKNAISYKTKEKKKIKELQKIKAGIVEKEQMAFSWGFI